LTSNGDFAWWKRATSMPSSTIAWHAKTRKIL
jgi:hypothetical protein